MSLNNAPKEWGCVMRPVECREQAAQCRRMAEREPNFRVQAILTDMARTWDRLAIEAEISHGPSLRVIPQLPSQARRKTSSENQADCESASEIAFGRKSDVIGAASSSPWGSRPASDNPRPMF